MFDKVLFRVMSRISEQLYASGWVSINGYHSYHIVKKNHDKNRYDPQDMHGYYVPTLQDARSIFEFNTFY